MSDKELVLKKLRLVNASLISQLIQFSSLCFDNENTFYFSVSTETDFNVMKELFLNTFPEHLENSQKLIEFFREQELNEDEKNIIKDFDSDVILEKEYLRYFTLVFLKAGEFFFNYEKSEKIKEEYHSIEILDSISKTVFEKVAITQEQQNKLMSVDSLKKEEVKNLITLYRSDIQRNDFYREQIKKWRKRYKRKTLEVKFDLLENNVIVLEELQKEILNKVFVFEYDFMKIFDEILKKRALLQDRILDYAKHLDVSDWQ